MWRLSQEQQDLAIQYFYIAKSTANKMEYARDPDRSLSASCYGLCYAAYKWQEGRGGKTFRNYAIWSCRKAIQSEFMRDNRNKRMDASEHYPYMAMTNASDWDLQRSYDDPIQALKNSDEQLNQRAKVFQALTILSPKERMVIKMTFAGMRQFEIEKQMGWRRCVAGAALHRGITKLKKVMSK